MSGVLAVIGFSILNLWISAMIRLRRDGRLQKRQASVDQTVIAPRSALTKELKQ